VLSPRACPHLPAVAAVAVTPAARAAPALQLVDLRACPCSAAARGGGRAGLQSARAPPPPPRRSGSAGSAGTSTACSCRTWPSPPRSSAGTGGACARPAVSWELLKPQCAPPCAVQASSPAPGGRWCHSRCRICVRPAAPRAINKRQRPCQCTLQWMLMGDVDLDADAGVGGALLALLLRRGRACDIQQALQARRQPVPLLPGSTQHLIKGQAPDTSQAGGVAARTSMMRPLVLCSESTHPQHRLWSRLAQQASAPCSSCRTELRESVGRWDGLAA